MSNTEVATTNPEAPATISLHELPIDQRVEKLRILHGCQTTSETLKRLRSFEQIPAPCRHRDFVDGIPITTCKCGEKTPHHIWVACPKCLAVPQLYCSYLVELEESRRASLRNVAPPPSAPVQVPSIIENPSHPRELRLEKKEPTNGPVRIRHRPK